MSSNKVEPENSEDSNSSKVPIAGEDINAKSDEPLPPAYNDIASTYPPVAASGVQNTAFSEPAPAQPAVTGQPATTVQVVTAPPVATGVIVQQPMMLGTLPCQTTCPYCSSLVSLSEIYPKASITFLIIKFQTITRTQYVTGPFTWMVCGGIFLFVCCLGCCLIPFCCNDCKDVHHHCSNCGRLISVQPRM